MARMKVAGFRSISSFMGEKLGAPWPDGGLYTHHSCKPPAAPRRLGLRYC